MEKPLTEEISADDLNLVELAVELTIAWLGNPSNRATTEEVPKFLRTMHATVSELFRQPIDKSGAPASDRPVPAVSVRKSLASKDHIISMIDGKPYKTLRRHLSTNGLTPDEYRQRFSLKADYPMVAENYSAQRRAMAKAIGLGAKGRAARSRDGAPAASKRSRRKSAPAT